jgi:hypothetical protein
LNIKNCSRSPIGVLGATIDGKTVNLTKKGGTRWETKAEKRIKKKVKNRKPANRPKKRRKKIAEAFSAAKVVGSA